MITFSSKHISGFNLTPFETVTFPAGEAHLKITYDFHPERFLYHIADIRGHDPQDLFMLAMWEKSLPQEAKKIVILPYIPGARADRGNPFGAAVYADFFNNLFIDRFIILDPHSHVAPSLFDNSEVLGGNNTVEFPFERIIRAEVQDKSSDTQDQPYDGVIAPDAGAVERAQRAANVMGVPVYTAGKTRDFETGALTGFHMEDELPEEGHFLLVDDICDGGGTFNGLADVIAKSNPKVELDLWVTHGVFSKGFDELGMRFKKIHTTDSYYAGESSDLVEAHTLQHHLYPEAARIGRELSNA